MNDVLNEVLNVSLDHSQILMTLSRIVSQCWCLPEIICGGSCWSAACSRSADNISSPPWFSNCLTDGFTVHSSLDGANRTDLVAQYKYH